MIEHIALGRNSSHHGARCGSSGQCPLMMPMPCPSPITPLMEQPNRSRSTFAQSMARPPPLHRQTHSVSVIALTVPVAATLYRPWPRRGRPRNLRLAFLPSDAALTMAHRLPDRFYGRYLPHRGDQANARDHDGFGKDEACRHVGLPEFVSRNGTSDVSIAPGCEGWNTGMGVDPEGFAKRLRQSEKFKQFAEFPGTVLKSSERLVNSVSCCGKPAHNARKTE